VRLAAAALALALAGDAPAASDWPDWQRFADRFIEPSGRVVDLTFDQKSTSEGQSYGMFFALVANDRARFDAILKWTSDNLAGGALGERLPAWHWGKRDDGSWGVKDPNAAADGELWMAYSLLEASRLWQEPAYEITARKLLERIKKEEVVDGGSAGMLLLPGPVGFVISGERYRIDLSYLPGFLLRYLATADPKGPWQAIWDAYVATSKDLYANGIAPDLYVVDRRGGISPDPERPLGAYDAIRVYLWAGMSGDAEMVRRLGRFAKVTRSRGAPPEKIDPASGAPLAGDYSPIGFSGALLPYLQALSDQETLDQQLRRLKLMALSFKPANYYDQALILFGKGWFDGAYRFDEAGRLVTRWAR
jgi:endoglucanase